MKKQNYKDVIFEKVVMWMLKYVLYIIVHEYRHIVRRFKKRDNGGCAYVYQCIQRYR